MNIAAVAIPIALLAGLAENADEGRKTGRMMVKKLMNSHIELSENLNRFDISSCLPCDRELDTAARCLFRGTHNFAWYNL